MKKKAKKMPAKRPKKTPATPIPDEPLTFNPVTGSDNLILEGILDCYRQLLPENLGDEAAQIRRTIAETERKLRGLFAAFGREVSEGEIFLWEREINQQGRTHKGKRKQSGGITMNWFDERHLEENNLVAIINRWSPKEAEDETVMNRLFRALVNANACVNDLRRVLRGESPIRPPDVWREVECPVVRGENKKIIWHGKPCPEEHLAKVEAELAGMLSMRLDSPQQLIFHSIVLDNNASVTAWGEPGDNSFHAEFHDAPTKERAN